jgi:coatomer subunit epsilon
VDTPVADANSPDYVQALVLHARAHVALGDPAAALSLLPLDSENVAIKAVSAFAKYFATPAMQRGDARLEPLRDLCVEIEDDEDSDEREKGLVKVLAGIVFANAGETEEALETLGAGSQKENLEAYVPRIIKFPRLLVLNYGTTQCRCHRPNIPVNITPRPRSGSV